ncbi:MAG TPA: DUF167 domain-containing protein [Candidatus Magasanikbacteria bacterium]|nr:DUF167 domain-containing protein [Candidatus Magasanikbacteria bacterium]
MRITITVKPRSSKIEVIQISETEYQVKLTASPVDGEANEQLLKVLSDYFEIPKTRISILKGKTGKKKIVEIDK